MIQELRETFEGGGRVRRFLAGASLLVLVVFLGTGCATTASRQDGEVRRKQARSHFNLGVDHLENGRTARGLRELLVAQSFDPQDPYIQYALGRAYLSAERDELAVQHLLRALDIHPDLHAARLTLSGVFVVLGFRRPVHHRTRISCEAS